MVHWWPWAGDAADVGAVDDAVLSAVCSTEVHASGLMLTLHL